MQTDEIKMVLEYNKEGNVDFSVKCNSNDPLIDHKFKYDPRFTCSYALMGVAYAIKLLCESIGIDKEATLKKIEGEVMSEDGPKGKISFLDKEN